MNSYKCGTKFVFTSDSKDIWVHEAGRLDCVNGRVSGAIWEKQQADRQLYIKTNDKFELIDSPFGSAFCYLYSEEYDATISVFARRLGQDFIVYVKNYNKYWAELNQ